MYTEQQLVSFGYYLLSDKRKRHVEDPVLRQLITDDDLNEWKAGEKDVEHLNLNHEMHDIRQDDVPA